MQEKNPQTSAQRPARNSAQNTAQTTQIAQNPAQNGTNSNLSLTREKNQPAATKDPAQNFNTAQAKNKTAQTHTAAQPTAHAPQPLPAPRYPTRQIRVGSVKIGGGAPISVQSMTFSKTRDIPTTLAQINRLYFAGADIVRCAVFGSEDARALAEIKAQSPLPVIADIHFNYQLALRVAPFVDAIRINPGNIGGDERIKAVADACGARGIPIRIGVNSGSLEAQFAPLGTGAEAMVASALYNAELLEKFGFSDIAISLKASDVPRTVAAYRALRRQVDYPFHLGVTEAGTTFHASIKSAIALGGLLLEGIGDTMRVSITGELEEEIRVARAILQDSGVQRSGLNIISCPTCGRLQSDLVRAVAMVEERTRHITAPLNISVMGCAVNAIGEAKGCDVGIAFGAGSGLVFRRGEVVAKMKDGEGLVERFLAELEDEVAAWEARSK